MKLLILTPESTLLEVAGLRKVRVPLVDNNIIGIHPGHHPLLAETRAGRIEYGKESYTNSFTAQAGILRVESDQVTLYTSGKQEEQEHPQSHKPTQQDQIIKGLEQQLEEGF